MIDVGCQFTAGRALRYAWRSARGLLHHQQGRSRQSPTGSASRTARRGHERICAHVYPKDGQSEGLARWLPERRRRGASRAMHPGHEASCSRSTAAGLRPLGVRPDDLPM